MKKIVLSVIFILFCMCSQSALGGKQYSALKPAEKMQLVHIPGMDVYQYEAIDELIATLTEALLDLEWSLLPIERGFEIIGEKGGETLRSTSHELRNLFITFKERKIGTDEARRKIALDFLKKWTKNWNPHVIQFIIDKKLSSTLSSILEWQDKLMDPKEDEAMQVCCRRV